MHAIVSSVGPYRFSTTEFGAAVAHARAMESGSGSPQKRLHRRVGKAASLSTPSFRIMIATDGTENQTVNSDDRTKPSGLISCLRVGTQRQAPHDHATNMSKTERSKVMSNGARSACCETRAVRLAARTSSGRSRSISAIAWR